SMTTVEPGAGVNIVDRAKNILIQPRAEWERIAAERTGLSAMLTGYVLPLAAIAAVCSFLGLSFIGVGGFGFSYRMPLIDAGVGAAVQVVMSLIGVWVMGLIVNALAPTFASAQDQTRANQLIVYSSTAGFLGGVFSLLPALSILALLAAIYGLVLLYLGLPRLMKTPEDKRLPYFITILIVALVVGIVVAAVLGAARAAVGGVGRGGGMMGPPFGMHRTVENDQRAVPLPNGQTVDISDLERAAEQMKAMAANPQAAANVAAINAEQLKALLPEALPGGFTRVETNTGSSGAMMGVSNASGVYTRGDARLELSLTDMGAAGALAAMAGAFGAQGSHETADGYERTGPVDGRLTTEEVNRPNRTAKYGVVAAQRILIQAHGSNITIDEARAAVNAVGVARAEALAQQMSQPAAAAANPG
ncbi:MAG: Yip1 family protein, partial [Hyphomonadaceae bacterium]